MHFGEFQSSPSSMKVGFSDRYHPTADASEVCLVPRAENGCSVIFDIILQEHRKSKPLSRLPYLKKGAGAVPRSFSPWFYVSSFSM
jgi:hypothetical protein